MTARISHITFDARDAYAQSVFWGSVLGFVEDPADPNLPGHDECMLYGPDGGRRVLFIEVPEGKTVKNRLHLDLEPVAGLRDAELADPEGNEFCILRNDAERAITGIP